LRVFLPTLVALLVLTEASLAAPLGGPPLSRQDGLAIAHAVASASDQGLQVPDQSDALAALSSSDPAARAAADSALSAAAVRLAAAEHGMRIDPRRIDSFFALRDEYDAATAFAAARAAGRIPAWVATLAPSSSSYGALVAIRLRYAQIASAGGWATIKGGKPLGVGAVDPRVPALRLRLSIEGYAAPASQPAERFDSGLSAALAAFQAHHGIEADGALSAATVAALNVSASARLATIDLNLERERWLANPLPRDRIEVNIADPHAVLFTNGAAVLPMRAIVGAPIHHSPSFASEVTSIVFNPPWYVPAAIAAAELYPKERASPGYLARNGFHVSNGQLIQGAGSRAALGYLKFDMPDPFQVYLHDTPNRDLFAHDKRWLSHGCIRLELPRDLAAALLRPQGWSRGDVDAAIARKVTRRVALTTPMPVFLVYRTATADDGAVAFSPDVYGWDAKLAAGLAGVGF
jgi:murein L,D-transpeptidase YcbB/YkuD